MDDQLSTIIFMNVMELAGTPAWDKWKADRRALGLPIIDGPQELPRSSPTTNKTGAAAVLP